MLTFIDKLRGAPRDILETMIHKQKCRIAIAQRDLETMQRVLLEKTDNQEIHSTPCISSGTCKMETGRSCKTKECYIPRC